MADIHAVILSAFSPLTDSEAEAAAHKLAKTMPEIALARALVLLDAAEKAKQPPPDLRSIQLR